MIRRQQLNNLLEAGVASVLAVSSVLLAQTHGQVDTVSSPTIAVPIGSVDFNKLANDLRALNSGESLSWASSAPDESSSGPELYGLGVNAYQNEPGGSATCANNYSAAPDRAVIFHIVHWIVPASANGVPQIQSSVWYVYRHRRIDNANLLVPADIMGTGDPLIYGAKHVVILNVDIPTDSSNILAGTNLQSTITAPVTQGTTDLSSDISALFSALTGISGTNATDMAATTPSPSPRIFVAVTCEDGTAKLPFSVQVADAAANPGSGGGGPAAAMAATTPDGQKSNLTSTTASGSVSCTGTGNTMPCTMGRTFTSEEHAYIDIGAGIATPGVRDTSFSFSANGSSPGATLSVTRHTDAYGLIDVFPLGAFLPRESPVPYINFGIPVTSQSLHRPYIGIAENVTGWTHLQRKLNLPVAVNVFGGIVFVETEQLSGAPITQTAFNSDLSTHWVHKAMFGIEVPISSVASKFSKNGGGSKGK